VSILLAVLVPALLMLATFGLSRLEAGLVRDTVTARDVADFLAQAEAVDVGTLARVGMPKALDDMHRRRTERIEEVPVLPGAPERAAQASRANP
jgi:hypothetical protein